MRLIRPLAAVPLFLLLAGCDPPSPVSPELPESDSETLPSIRHLITSADGTLELPFAEVVRQVSGREVLVVDPSGEDKALIAILDGVSEALNTVLVQMSAADSPVRGKRRINEASRHFEDALIQILNATPGLTADVPVTAEGEHQRSGYPDIRIVHRDSGRVAYLDPKLYEASAEKSSLRTFYFTPRTATNKVLVDAYHLLLGISHDGNDGAWTFQSWKIVDLSNLNVRLKPEFQASNRDLYQPESVVRSSP